MKRKDEYPMCNLQFPTDEGKERDKVTNNKPKNFLTWILDIQKYNAERTVNLTVRE